MCILRFFPKTHGGDERSLSWQRLIWRRSKVAQRASGWDLLTGGVIKGLSSLSLLLISRLRACVLSYVSAAWEIERDEGKRGHHPPAAPLIPRHQVNYNYCSTKTLCRVRRTSSDLKTSPAVHPSNSLHSAPIIVEHRVHRTAINCHEVVIARQSGILTASVCCVIKGGYLNFTFLCAIQD